MEDNPLEGARPPIILEEDFNKGIFPSMDPQNHPYTMDEDRVMAMDDNPMPGGKPPNAKYRVHKSGKPMDKPNHGDPKDHQPLTMLIDISGHKALTLMDSGCTIEVLSPTHIQLTNGKIHQLTDQHSLQLGTVGSHAKFNYGMTMQMAYSGICEDVYYDIINIDRYDAIMGTQFMHRHGIQLDFDKGLVLVKGVPAPTLTVGEDHAEFMR